MSDLLSAIETLLGRDSETYKWAEQQLALGADPKELASTLQKEMSNVH